MNRSLIVLAALMMAACSHSEPRTPGRYIEKLTVAEKPRDFILHVPKGYDHTKDKVDDFYRYRVVATKRFAPR